MGKPLGLRCCQSVPTPTGPGYLGVHLASGEVRFSLENLTFLSPGRHTSALSSFLHHGSPLQSFTHPTALCPWEKNMNNPLQQLLRMHLGLVASVLLGKESSGSLRSLSYNQKTATPRPQHIVGLVTCVLWVLTIVGSVAFSHHWRRKLPISKGCGLGLGPCISPSLCWRNKGCSTL